MVGEQQSPSQVMGRSSTISTNCCRNRLFRFKLVRAAWLYCDITQTSVLLPNTLCPVWHCLTGDHSDRIESIQRRVMKIIFADCTCQFANLPSLVDRREQLTRRFFSRICNVNNCLHYLLPKQRDSRITNSLRTAKKFPVPFAKTTRFKNSFILYALANLQ